MRRSAILITLIAVASITIVAPPAVGHPRHQPRAQSANSNHCRTFRGPGDSLIHSGDFRANHMSCRSAKKVVESCGIGRHCHAVGRFWNCTGHIPGREHCASGRRSVGITWFD